MKMMEGMLSAKGRSVGIVASRFNELVVSSLVEGARDCFARHGGDLSRLAVARVPGAYEIPLVAGRLAGTGRYDAIVALGAVIRGSTPHFDFVATEVSKGVAAESLRTGVPIAFGVLTCESMEQALERAGLKAGNKGAEAMLSAIEMADLLSHLED